MSLCLLASLFVCLITMNFKVFSISFCFLLIIFVCVFDIKTNHWIIKETEKEPHLARQSSWVHDQDTLTYNTTTSEYILRSHTVKKTDRRSASTNGSPVPMTSSLKFRRRQASFLKHFTSVFFRNCWQWAAVLSLVIFCFTKSVYNQTQTIVVQKL